MLGFSHLHFQLCFFGVIVVIERHFPFSWILLKITEKHKAFKSRVTACKNMCFGTCFNIQCYGIRPHELKGDNACIINDIIGRVFPTAQDRVLASF